MGFYKTANALLESAKEQSTWVIIFKFNGSGNRYGGTYKFLPLDEMSKEDKEILDNSNPYNVDNPNTKAYILDNLKHRYIFRLGSKNNLKNILKLYKQKFKLKEIGLEAKPETKKHFGDIMNALNENKEEKWAYLLKVKAVRNSADTATYKFLPYSSLSDADLEMASQLYDETPKYGHGRYEDRTDIKVYMSRINHKIGVYRFVKLIVGPKVDLQRELHHAKKYQFGTRMKEEIKLKPKTKKHFGDILGALNEAVENIIFKVTKVTKSEKYLGNDEDMYTLRITDKLSKKKYMVKQLIPVWSPHEKETEIYVMQPQLKGTGTHGQMVHTGMQLVATAWGPDIKNEIMQNMSHNNLTATPHIPGMKNKSRASQQDDSAEKELQQLGSFLNNLTVKELDKILHVQKMKPKTREHFGDILTSL